LNYPPNCLGFQSLQSLRQNRNGRGAPLERSII